MIWFLLLAIIFVGLNIFWWNDTRRLEDWSFEVFLPTFAITLFLSFPLIWISIATMEQPTKFHTTKHEIVSMQDGNRTSGGGGFLIYMMRTDDTYSYYERHGKAFKLNTTYASDVLVYQDAKLNDAYVLTRCPDRSDQGWTWYDYRFIKGDCTKEFHVPPGSIVEDFTLDGK